ncbi:hypothetical protein Tco_1500407 [Tanacetum coccineum]
MFVSCGVELAASKRKGAIEYFMCFTWIQLQAKEFDLMAGVGDLDEIEEEEQYTKLLEPIPEPHQLQQNDSNDISEVPSVEQVEKVNMVNRKLRETNVDLTTERARYKNQEKCFEISQEKYDKLERCYQKSVYQEEIANLNTQLSKEKSTYSSLQEEKKKLKSDFKIRKDELLDKQIQLENKIKELDNIFVKMGQ